MGTIKVVVMDGCRIRTIGTKSAIEDFDPELAIEWRKTETKEEDGYRVHRTTKNRWSLIKLISRIGNNAKNKSGNKSWITDQDAHVVHTINNLIN